MARFDAFNNPDGSGLLLDVQADILSHLNTRVVVPLLPPPVAPLPMERLNPVLSVDGQETVMMTHYLSAVPVKILSAPVTNLENQRDAIVGALDFLQQGS